MGGVEDVSPPDIFFHLLYSLCLLISHGYTLLTIMVVLWMTTTTMMMMISLQFLLVDGAADENDSEGNDNGENGVQR